MQPETFKKGFENKLILIVFKMAAINVGGLYPCVLLPVFLTMAAE